MDFGAGAHGIHSQEFIAGSKSDRAGQAGFDQRRFGGQLADVRFCQAPVRRQAGVADDAVRPEVHDFNFQPALRKTCAVQRVGRASIAQREFYLRVKRLFFTLARSVLGLQPTDSMCVLSRDKINQQYTTTRTIR